MRPIIVSRIKGKPDKISSIPTYMGFLVMLYIPSVTSLSGALVGMTVVFLAIKRPVAMMSRKIPTNAIKKPATFPIKPNPRFKGEIRLMPQHSASKTIMINKGYLFMSPQSVL